MKYTKIVAIVGFLYRKRYGFVRQFSSNWSANFRNPTKIGGTGAKKALSLYFRADFNNLSTILTRIVSRFQIYIQNWNTTSAVRLALFSKYVTKNWLLFEQFSSDVNDSHVNLTRIVSQIHSCFRNKNRTSVARTATILVCVIEFSCQTQ
jgi:hypothetical protein